MRYTLHSERNATAE